MREPRNRLRGCGALVFHRSGRRDLNRGPPVPEALPEGADPVEMPEFPEKGRLSAGMVFPHFGIETDPNGHLNGHHLAAAVEGGDQGRYRVRRQWVHLAESFLLALTVPAPVF